MEEAVPEAPFSLVTSISSSRRRISRLIFDQPSSQELAIASACLVGVLTGISVVLFNNCVHLLRDFSWDGIIDRGASWLREEPIESIWLCVILVPTISGLLVSVLKQLREAAGDSVADSDTADSSLDRLKVLLRPFLKAVAACVTLGTGNSLGLEGSSVEIGASIAKGVNSLFNKSPQTGLPLLAAGSASGISSAMVEINSSSSVGAVKKEQEHVEEECSRKR